MRRSLSLALILVAAVSTPLAAAPLVQSLPEDGSWVTYHAGITIEGRESSTEWTIRSVGTKSIGGNAHRWIEMDGHNAEGTRVVIKLLVPENAFGHDGNPFDSAREIWARVGEEEVRQAANLREGDIFLALIVEGPTKNIQALDEKDKVQWQRGELECAVTTGESSTTFNTAEIDVRHRIRRHADVPFQLAAVTHDFTVRINDQTLTAKVDLVLQDHGKDAKSELPDIQ